MKQNKDTIKSYFETGDKPTQQEYHDTWDSFRHKDENITYDNGDTGLGFSGADSAHLIAGGANALSWTPNGEIIAPITTNTVIDNEVTGKILVTKDWVDTKDLHEITNAGNSTSNNIELLGGNITITDGETPSNLFNGNLNINYTEENSGNVFSIYNRITKTKSASGEFLYGVNNLINHNAPEDTNQVYGTFNRVRTQNSGTPNEMIGTFNQASYRNTGSGTVNLMSGSENYVNVDDYGGTGSIANAIGIRGKVVQKSENTNLENVYGGVFELELSTGNIANWTGVLIDLDQSGGTVASGEYLKIDAGVQLPNTNLKAINSASNTILPTKEWVQANTASKFVGTIGDGTSTTLNITHGLTSEDVIIQVRDVATKTVVACTKTIIDANTISVTFDTAPSLDQNKVVVIA